MNNNSMLAVIDSARYNTKEYNVLLPTKFLSQVSPFLTPTIEIVSIDTSEKSVDIYSPPGDFSKYALHVEALDRIADAAGLSYQTERIDNGSCLDYVHMKCRIAFKKADGTVRIIEADKEIDLRVVEDDLNEQYTKKAQGRKHYDGAKKGQALSEKEKQEFIVSSVKRDLLQWRRHKLARAQSGAIGRAIRKILGMQSAYTLEDLKKPFVVPKIIFTPDLSDPDIKQFMLRQGSLAVGTLFGNGVRGDELNRGDREVIVTSSVVEDIKGGNEDRINHVISEDIEQEVVTIEPEVEDNLFIPFEKLFIERKKEFIIESLAIIYTTKKVKLNIRKPIQDMTDEELNKVFKYLENNYSDFIKENYKGK